MDENSLSSCEILNVKMSEITQMVDTLKQYSTDSDIPSVFEEANKLLKQLLPDNGSYKMSQEEQEIEFDKILSQKERDFIIKADKEIENLSIKIDNIQKSIHEDDQSIQKILKSGELFKLAEIGKLTKHYNAIIQENENEFNAQKGILVQKEKDMYAKYEKDLAARLADVSAENTGKIESLNNQINSMQRDLQSMIHQKHQQNTLKADAFAEEDRRMATEHEQISREYHTRKNEADDKIKRFTSELARIEKSIENESQTAQDKIQALERAMMNERNLVVEKHNKVLSELQQTWQTLTTNLAAKNSLIESEHTQAVTELKKAEREAKKKIEKEQNETEELITAARVQIEINYRPRVESLRKIIEDTQNQRGKELEILRQQILQSNEESEKSIAIAMSHYQNEREKEKMAVKELKDELNNLKEEKRVDLDELTKSLQLEVGKVLQEADEADRKHNDEINKIMQKFDEQQKYLTELHRVSVEAHDKMRADELARLKQEHEQRKNQLIFKLEQQAKIDRENLLASAIEAENQRHNIAIVSLKARIVELQSRIELLNMKFEGLYSVHGQRIEELQKSSRSDKTETESIQSVPTERTTTEDPNAEEDESAEQKLQNELKQKQEELKKKGEAEIDEIKSLSNKLMQETGEVNRTKARILSEVDEINKNFAAMREDFETKMFQIKSKFLAQKTTYDSQSRVMDSKSQHLQDSIANQEEKIEELTQIADRKEIEAVEFEQKIPEEEEKFREQTEKNYQTNLETIKAQPDDFADRVKSVTDEIHEKMFEISKLIEAEKINTEKISKMLMNERKEIFAQVEKVIRTEFKDRKKIFYKNYEKVISRMDADYDEKFREHQKKMDEIEMQQRVQRSQFIDQHAKLMLDMEEEKERIMKESEQLDREISELETMECPQCVQKKASIKLLLQQRDALYNRLGIAAEQLEESDKKVGTLFKGVKRAKVSRSMMENMKPKVLVPKPPMIRL